MTEALQTALLTLAGVALGGLLTGWFQRSNTKTLIVAELNKLRVQLEGEARTRFLARKQDGLLEAVPKLLAAADPELHTTFNYSEVVTLIHRIELLIDPSNSDEERLNKAIGQLGFAVQAAETGDRNVHRILGAQAEVTKAARVVLRNAF
ncbi:hypothetical protein P2G88_02830 [Aliiglaciecola sp. CAU 1673]|uniref:hypothetical protein n=1 Tax=Aliiglaciecola sp. CAU 1673 TaxID=3032595 RepID=UPI0023DB3C8E|nr:hypothetical protein [Aliiglaciecola sp. CAU 1673]MDF2177178.1 hypothetical protein [Aliiglaciecola sp. CAU 1673]